MKKQPIEWDKIFANLICDKEYVKNFYHSTKKPNNPLQKWTKKLNRYFSKDNIRMFSKHMKRCSISLVIGETQIKPQ